jgi:hypothetical protein
MNSKEQRKYEQVLQELKNECNILMDKYAPKLHTASHEDNIGIELSHLKMVRKIRQDCIRVYDEAVHKITFSGKGEDEVIEEILEYNYDKADVDHMIKVENTDLFSHLQSLNENCIKRTDPEWYMLGIHELLQSGKANPGPVGSKRTQFC